MRLRMQALISIAILSVLGQLTLLGAGQDLRGDLNDDGVLSVADAVLAFQSLTGSESFPLEELDYNVDGRFAVEDAVLLMRRVVGWDDDQTLSPWWKTTLVAGDGAWVEFPIHSVDARSSAIFEKAGEAAPGIRDDRISVSPVYLLTVDDPTAVSGHLRFRVPADLSQLPEEMSEAEMVSGLVIETRETPGAEWEIAVTGASPEYDAEKGTFWFDAQPFGTKEEVAADPVDSSVFFQTGSATRSKEYRVTSYYWGLGSQVYTTLPGSAFTIHYYPPATGKPHSIVADAVWGMPAGADQYPYTDVPDYVEDLDRALNESYGELLKLKTNTGGFVFNAFSETRLDVYVTDLGGANGNTTLGGLGGIKIAKSMPSPPRGLSRLDMLKATAAHELVHVLQGDHYTAWGIFRGASDRWFLDAMAQYYGALASGFGSRRQGAYWSALSDDYLGVSITASNEESFYALAHFFHWLVSEYAGNIPGDALFQSRTTALLDLGQAIQQQGGPGLTSAFGDYLNDLIRSPEGLFRTNGFLKDQLQKYTAVHHLSSQKLFFREQGGYNFIRLRKNMAPLSAAYFALRAANQNPGLLVVDPSASSEIEFEWLALDFVGKDDADYQGKTPVSDGMSFLRARESPPTISGFGQSGTSEGLEFLVANHGTSFSHDVDVAIYLLQAPEITEVSSDSVTWSTGRLGNIPVGYLSGYTVSVNRIPKGSLALLSGEDVPQELRLDLPDLAAGDQVVVHVIDRYGNTWPEIIAPEAPSFPSTEIEQAWDRATVKITVRSDAPLTELVYRFHDGGEISLLEQGSASQITNGRYELEREFEIDLRTLPNGSYPLRLRATDSNALSSDYEETLVIDDLPPDFENVEIVVEGDTATVQVSTVSGSPLTGLQYQFHSSSPVSILGAVSSTQLSPRQFRSQVGFPLDLQDLADGNYPLLLKAVDSRELEASVERFVTKGGEAGGPYFVDFALQVSDDSASVRALVASGSPLSRISYSLGHSGGIALDCPSPSDPDPDTGEYLTPCQFSVDLSGLLCGEFALEISATDTEERTGTISGTIMRDEVDECDREGDFRDFLPGVWWWTWEKTSGDDFYFSQEHEDDVRFSISGRTLTITEWGSGSYKYLGEYTVGGGLSFVAVRRLKTLSGSLRYEIRGTFREALFGRWGWYWEGTATITDTRNTDDGSSIVRTATYDLTGSKLGN